MLGFTRTGCFFIGIVMGFVLALALAFFIVFQCDPGFRDSVRRFWTSVKGGVDDTLKAPPKPGAHRPREPRTPQGSPAPARGVPAPAPKPAVPARTVNQAPPRTVNQAPPRPRGGIDL